MGVIVNCQTCGGEYPMAMIHSRAACAARLRVAFVALEKRCAELEQKCTAQALELEGYQIGSEFQAIDPTGLDRVFPQFAHIPERLAMWNILACRLHQDIQSELEQARANQRQLCHEVAELEAERNRVAIVYGAGIGTLSDAAELEGKPCPCCEMAFAERGQA